MKITWSICHPPVLTVWVKYIFIRLENMLTSHRDMKPFLSAWKQTRRRLWAVQTQLSKWSVPSSKWRWCVYFLHRRARAAKELSWVSIPSPERLNLKLKTTQVEFRPGWKATLIQKEAVWSELLSLLLSDDVKSTTCISGLSASWMGQPELPPE